MPDELVVTASEPRKNCPEGSLSSLAKNSIVKVLFGLAVERPPMNCVPPETACTDVSIGAAWFRLAPGARSMPNCVLA